MNNKFQIPAEELAVIANQTRYWAELGICAETVAEPVRLYLSRLGLVE